MGELLKQFDDRRRPSEIVWLPMLISNLSQRDVAEKAGISKYQQVQAVRAANAVAH